MQHFQIVRETPKALTTKDTMKVVVWLQRNTGGRVIMLKMNCLEKQ